jgi:hypothetical protein
MWARRWSRWGAGARAAILAGALTASGAPLAPCRINVVEKGSGWPVPLVELSTTHGVRFVSDNAGVIAFDLPEGMGREVWFNVLGHGYEIPRDGFGYRGVRLTPQPGATLTVQVTRTMVARRLGRVTGAGQWGESQKLGLPAPGGESGVFGCDSVQTAEYQGKLFWVWGDTTLPHYPLGIFHASNATTARRPLATFEPPVFLPFEYFREANGRPRSVAKLPGEGPTWLSGLVVLPDASGRERLVALYAKVKAPLEVYEFGLCAWNDATAAFEGQRVVWRKSAERPEAPPVPDGHAFLAPGAAGERWVYFGNPLPTLRCPATYEAWLDPTRWEKLTPPGTLAGAAGKSVQPHSGSIAWQPWRQRWVTVFMEKFGKPSAFGELWYAEADAPEGPWGPAVKVLSHENYTFYNPRIHAGWAEMSSPVLVFEGTFTREFADRPPASPRYDYNQVLYRLDLDSPTLAPARGGATKAAR